MKKVFLGSLLLLIIMALVGCKKNSKDEVTELSGTQWMRQGTTQIVDFSMSYKYIWTFQDESNMNIQAFSGMGTEMAKVSDTNATYSADGSKMKIKYQYTVINHTQPSDCELTFNYTIKGSVLSTEMVDAFFVDENGNVTHISDLQTSENQYTLQALNAVKDIYNGEWTLVK